MDHVLAMVGQVGAALEHIHERGLVHRDVKPVNIFISEDGTLKLGDFGLARKVNAEVELSAEQDSMSMSSMTQTNGMSLRVGTARYASPEQREGRKYDAKTDLYSLGLILYELCLSKPATAMQMEREARGRPVRSCLPSAEDWLVRRDHPDVVELMSQLLEWEPTKRPPASKVVARCKELRSQTKNF
jgi:serine/threonine protein kinase